VAAVVSTMAGKVATPPLAATVPPESKTPELRVRSMVRLAEAPVLTRFPKVSSMRTVGDGEIATPAVASVGC